MSLVKKLTLLGTKVDDVELGAIDRRAAELGLNRSDYLRLLFRRDLAEGGVITPPPAAADRGADGSPVLLAPAGANPPLAVVEDIPVPDGAGHLRRAWLGVRLYLRVARAALLAVGESTDQPRKGVGG